MIKMTMLVRHILVIGLVASATGCTSKFGMLMTNDRFAYPNANIEPLGRVTATVSKSTWFAPAMVDKQMYDEVRRQALQQKGGDMILDAKLTTTITMFPIPIINYWVTKLTVDGTAAKQTLGRQELK
ncbi:MAG: hypothetical protein FJY85_17180 [Deltaproteobacteria bacterium]|nr:hypothetical protein [Deltaproteobacteria bacterium]